MAALLGVVGVSYVVGMVVSSCFVYPSRVGLNLFAYLSAFMHVPSRRAGIPWVIKTYVKALGWPVVLGIWLLAGRPASTVFYGPEASRRLGQSTHNIPYDLRGFATKWTA